MLQVQRKITVDASSDYRPPDGLFPKLLGSHLQLKSPALELAKMICKVFLHFAWSVCDNFR